MSINHLSLYIIACIFPFISFAQKIYHPARGSEERKAHMKALHTTFDGKFKDQQIVFEADSASYKSNGQWCFLRVDIYQRSGKRVDFKKSTYKELWTDGSMDSNGIYALLQQIKSEWKLIAYFDFPLDVPYGCWWKQYKVPKQIFPYTEPASNCE